MNKFSKVVEKRLLALEEQLQELISAFAIGEITKGEFDEVGDEIKWMEEHLRINMEHEIAGHLRAVN
ncbi:hypothetical protein ACFL2E_05525 [Thermodesulfobacteriota bacterium]